MPQDTGGETEVHFFLRVLREGCVIFHKSCAWNDIVWRTSPHPASLALGFPSPIYGRGVVNAVNRGEGQSRSDF